MSKKRYFFNFIYLSLCALFIALASFLNFNDSSAKQEVETVLNGEYQLEEEKPQQITSNNYEKRQKLGDKRAYAIATSYQATYSPVINQTITSNAPQSTPYSSYISIAGRTLRIEDVNDTLIDSTDHVNRWGKKFLYGHNSAGVFGPIRNLSNGATFTALLDGELHTYQVAYTETMEKPKVEQNMGAIAYARYGGTRYDLSLMTCAGTSLGGGDATHRFIILARMIS